MGGRKVRRELERPRGCVADPDKGTRRAVGEHINYNGMFPSTLILSLFC
jgi:hypothetical protein